MTRRRLERLEDQAGTGRAAWARWAAVGVRACLEAVDVAGAAEYAPTVRWVFAGFRAGYALGADPHAAADRALDGLRDSRAARRVRLLAYLMRAG